MQRFHSSPVRPASDSIAKCHALFNCETRLGLSYDNLEESVKRTLCFSAGLKQRHITLKLHEMTMHERKALHRAINLLADALKPLAHHSLKEFR
ncbi:hypothetical protein [Photobacterium ganghwense]|uniref:hypothetical protein n=1 Tax=Photobacterium ganghwense TaxID=320778 RepID=UPI001A8F0CDF|nr:hypothetical protein [Photobacterium ganghwense]QSV15853.1 hypothetical protein FH974_21610 [Photobacterium ganghwense]